MKQGLISVGICCNQMKYGTVAVEKGASQTCPAQHRGELKEAGVSQPARSTCTGAQPRGVCCAAGAGCLLRGEGPVGSSPQCRPRSPAAAGQLTTAGSSSPRAALLCLSAGLLPEGPTGGLVGGSLRACWGCHAQLRGVP